MTADLEARAPGRVHAVEAATEVLQEFVRDDVCDAQLIIRGIDRRAWDELDGHIVHSRLKRQALRSVTGGPIITVDFELDGGR